MEALKASLGQTAGKGADDRKPPKRSPRTAEAAPKKAKAK